RVPELLSGRAQPHFNGARGEKSLPAADCSAVPGNSVIFHVSRRRGARETPCLDPSGAGLAFAPPAHLWPPGRLDVIQVRARPRLAAAGPEVCCPWRMATPTQQPSISSAPARGRRT